MAFLGGCFSVLCAVSILADAFKEGSGVGLMYLFVPGYSLYFICTRWVLCRKSFFFSLIAAYFFAVGLYVYETIPPPDPRKQPAASAPMPQPKSPWQAQAVSSPWLHA